jgi:signal peptidase I
VKFNFWSKKKETAPKTTKEKIRENVKAIIIALVVALLIRSFLVQAFYIPSGSMKPGLLEGDYLFVTKYNYGYSNHSLPFSLPLLPSSRIFYTEPVRGDVVIFKYPGDNDTDYVKRLIGLPGDKIQVINSIVYINDVPLRRELIETAVIDGLPINVYREYMPNGVSYIIWQIKGYYSYESQFYGPITLGENEFFMMGDNRDNSRDSRFSDVGAVPKANLVGKGGMIFFSIDGSFMQVWKWFTDIRFERIFKVVK